MKIRHLICSTLFLLMTLLACCIPDSLEIDSSMIKESYELSVYEPSGLSYSFDKKSFYVVSDRGGIYQISKTGRYIKQISNLSGDLEGISIDHENKVMFVVNENKSNVQELDQNSKVLDEYSILGAAGNEGLEGITYDSTRGLLYMLKEKSPGSLIKYSLVNKTKTVIQLGFANDYSGIFYNALTDNLWILSDESKTISKCSLNGKLITSYNMPVSSMEGLLVNPEETEAYVVSDKNKRLYIIDLEKY